MNAPWTIATIWGGLIGELNLTRFASREEAEASLREREAPSDDGYEYALLVAMPEGDVLVEAYDENHCDLDPTPWPGECE